MLSWDMLLGLHANLYAELHIKFGLYNGLKDLPNTHKHIPEYIEKYYNPTTKIFNPKQLSAIKSCDVFCMSKAPDSWRKTLVVESMQPFKGIYYTPIARVEKKSKKYNSIICTPTGVIRKTDILYCAGKKYTINTIFWQDEEMEEALPNDRYSIGLKETCELPERGSEIYKVEEL